MRADQGETVSLELRIRHIDIGDKKAETGQVETRGCHPWNGTD